jgi:hypothetical protein
MSENQDLEKVELPKQKIAFVIDDEVVDIIHTDQRLAAILLSEPLMLDVSDKFIVGEVPGVWIGDAYNSATDTFIRPQPTE